MQFAANLSMLFTEHEFLDRFNAARKAGFEAVEFLFPYEWPAEKLAVLLRENGLKQVLFNMAPGNWSEGERGLAAQAGREAEFRDSVKQAIEYALALGCPRLHCMAGHRNEDVSLERQLGLFRDNLAFAANETAAHGIQLLIEPLNPFDNPGYFLADFALAEAIVRDTISSGEPGPRLQFDIYHCERTHGDTANRIKQTADITAHYQIAGTPDRHEPNVGSLPLGEVLKAVRTANPDFWIGCEYRPRHGTVEGLAWRDDFSGNA